MSLNIQEWFGMIDLYTKHELLGGNAMNSRERVHAVLNHQLPDRVPNGLGGCETAGLHVIAYDNLQELMGVEQKPARVDTFMMNAVFEEPVIRAMDGDLILLASLICVKVIYGETQTGNGRNRSSGEKPSPYRCRIILV